MTDSRKDGIPRNSPGCLPRGPSGGPKVPPPTRTLLLCSLAKGKRRSQFIRYGRISLLSWCAPRDLLRSIKKTPDQDAEPMLGHKRDARGAYIWGFSPQKLSSFSSYRPSPAIAPSLANLELGPSWFPRYEIQTSGFLIVSTLVAL